MPSPQNKQPLRFHYVRVMTNQVLPGLFLVFFLIIGTIILIYMLNIHQNIPNNLVVGFTVTFSVFLALEIVGCIFLYRAKKLRQQAEGELKSTPGDGEQGVNDLEIHNALKKQNLKPELYSSSDRQHVPHTNHHMPGSNGSYSIHRRPSTIQEDPVNQISTPNIPLRMQPGQRPSMTPVSAASAAAIPEEKIPASQHPSPHALRGNKTYTPFSMNEPQVFEKSAQSGSAQRPRPPNTLSSMPQSANPQLYHSNFVYTPDFSVDQKCFKDGELGLEFTRRKSLRDSGVAFSDPFNNTDQRHASAPESAVSPRTRHTDLGISDWFSGGASTISSETDISDSLPGLVISGDDFESSLPVQVGPCRRPDIHRSISNDDLRPAYLRESWRSNPPLNLQFNRRANTEDDPDFSKKTVVKKSPDR